MGLYQSGTGAPEGFVTAGIATLWAQTDGANGAVTWRKISGTGNKGWEELQGSMGVVRPEEYGAVDDDPDDGTAAGTDDTAALQNAINAAVSSKRRLLLRRKYRVTDTLTVSDSLLIEGLGYQSAIHQTTRERNVFTISGADVTVQNLRLRGDNGTTGIDAAKNHGIYVDGARRLRMLHCWAHQFESCGIRVANANDVIIHGCFFFDNVQWDTARQYSYEGSDIALSPGSPINHRVTIAENHCLSNNSQGIYVNATHNDTEVKVIGNTCVALDTSGNEIAPASLRRRHGILSTYNGTSIGGRIVVANNIVRNTLRTGIYYTSDVGTSYCPAVITGNYVSQTGILNDMNPGGIALLAQGEGHVITSNIVEDIATGPGIFISTPSAWDPSATMTGRTLVANNVVRRCTDPGVNYAALVLQQRCHDVLVTGNLFIDNSTRDIFLSADASSNVPGDIVIRGNFFKKSVAAQAIHIDPQASNKLVLVEGNYIHGGGLVLAGVYFRASTIVIKRNTFVSCPVGVEAGYYTPVGRHLDYPQIDYNVFRDCDNGIRVGATDPAGATQVLEGNVAVGTGNLLQDWIGGGPSYKSGYIGRRAGTRLIAEGSVAPTLGTWAVGDEVGSTLPGVSGPSRLMCTTAGSPGTWTPVAFAQGVSGDRGDVSVTLTVGTDRPTQLFATNLTSNRTVILATSGAQSGDHFRIVRAGLGVGTLDVGPGLKLIPGATRAFVDVAFNGSAWILAGYGLLDVLQGLTDLGNANVTLTVGASLSTQRFNTPLTANRTVTLSATNARNGDRFRIVKNVTGGSVDVGPGLKTVAANTKAFVDVEYTGAAWVQTAYGTL